MIRTRLTEALSAMILLTPIFRNTTYTYECRSNLSCVLLLALKMYDKRNSQEFQGKGGVNPDFLY